MRLDLYVNKETNEADKILNHLGITMDDIPRCRGIGYQDGEILIHTRSGGGNREWMKEENEKLQGNPNYLRDEDDEYDSTYANFYFSA